MEHAPPNPAAANPRPRSPASARGLNPHPSPRACAAEIDINNPRRGVQHEIDRRRSAQAEGVGRRAQTPALRAAIARGASSTTLASLEVGTYLPRYRPSREELAGGEP